MTSVLADIRGASPDPRLEQIVKLTIFAVGGQGGGVLNEWIVDLAHRNGYDVQATSVAGVAQRTGATIYYVEMLPKSGAPPVFALSPAEGDVDILLAAELMEAGRAVTRGFVTPDRTKVIASTHRQFATVEKVVPGNGMAEAGTVMATLREQASELVAFDMQRIAEEEGTVISATMFGALAGSGALPFDVDSFRETVRASGRGVEKSLAAFERACHIAAGGTEPTAPSEPAAPRQAGPGGPQRLLAQWTELEQRVAELPEPAQQIGHAGLRKVVEFQDLAYGRTYLDRLEDLARADESAGGALKNWAFTATAAKYLANAMAYDDIIRVADAKTRDGRFQRIEDEVGAGKTHLVRITEYTHPGAAEVISLFPRRLGAWVESRDRLVSALDQLVNRGRHIRTDRVGGFLSLYLVAGLRRWRRSLLRHERELAHIDAWIATAQTRLRYDYDLAVETLRMRRLVKGYSDTLARGLTKFDKVAFGATLLEGRPDAADWTRRLTEAALKDEKGDALEGALKTVHSFVAEST
jgi:indolepyruvate ferredoxin oxidoreductase beta subunit